MVSIVALAGIVMVLAVLVTLHRVMDTKLILGYATEIDIVFSLAMLIFFSASLTGLLSSAFAGLALSVLLSIGRMTFGYTRYRVVRYGMRFGVAKVRTPPVWKDKIENLRVKHGFGKSYEWATKP